MGIYGEEKQELGRLFSCIWKNDCIHTLQFFQFTCVIQGLNVVFKVLSWFLLACLDNGGRFCKCSLKLLASEIVGWVVFIRNEGFRNSISACVSSIFEE